MIDGFYKQLAESVIVNIHADQKEQAAKDVIRALNIRRVAINSQETANEVLTFFLHDLMEHGGTAEAARMLWTPTQFTPEPQSVKDLWNLWDTSDMALVMGAASMGKCLGLSEVCRKADGTVILAKDVKRGDLLMGDDGTPRKVLNTVTGKGKLFKISLDRAPSFVCNEEHVLSLICTLSKKNHGGKSKTISSGYTRGKIIDVSVKEYLTWSKNKKRYYKMFVAPIVLSEKSFKVDPYIYGSWLGDGTCCRCELTSPDGEMMAEWKRYWTALGYRVMQQNKPITWVVRNQEPNTNFWGTAWVKESVIGGEKRIRKEYFFGSIEQRFQLLAGILDADGEYRSGSWDIATKWPGFALDIERLARSLGFLCRRYARKHRIKSRNFEAEYQHIAISGDVLKIPVKEGKYKRSSRFIVDGKAVSKFSVEEIGEGEYAGFSLDGNHRFQLASGIVTHNSFSLGARIFLEWVRDPDWTTVRVLGPSENHLEANLFSHLVALHSSATLTMPGEIGELFIGASRRDQLSAITGVVIPKGNNKKAGRLQGGKRRPRKKPHPIFGPMSRMFLFLDEIENIPMGIWHDIDNVLSNIDTTYHTFKILGAYNPSNPGDEVAKRAEPVGGWQSLDEDKTFRWKSARGWDVLRLDGERSENVVQGKVIYPGLQTREGLELIAKSAGGKNSPNYRTMGRGLYPASGIESVVIPAGMLLKWRGEFVWYSDPQPVSSTDLALEGGDDAVHTIGRFGLASGIKWPPSVQHPAGHTTMFKGPNGQVAPRWALQADTQLILPKGETVASKDNIITLNRKSGVKPDYYACDRTGHGAGVADLIKFEWGTQIHDVNYSESASEQKLMQEDTKTCKEAYDRVATELWFALRAWGEFQYFLIAPTIDMSKLTQQISQRRYRVMSGKAKIESKRDFETRGFGSPNEADSLTLLVHAARKGSQLILSMRGETVEIPGAGDETEYWFTGNNQVKVDPSNTSDFLDERQDGPSREIWEQTRDMQIL